MRGWLRQAGASLPRLLKRSLIIIGSTFIIDAIMLSPVSSSAFEGYINIPVGISPHASKDPHEFGKVPFIGKNIAVESAPPNIQRRPYRCMNMIFNPITTNEFASLIRPQRRMLYG